MACLLCGNLSHDTKDFSLIKLEASANAGCCYCSFLKHCLFAFFRPMDIRSFRFYETGVFDVAIISVYLRNDYHLHTYGPAIAREYDRENLAIFRFPGDKAAASWAKTQLPMPDDPGSDEAFNFIESCLDRCVLEHVKEICPTEATNDIFPSRVVDVSKESIRVMNYTKSIGSYLALSHCWGTGIPIKLESSTFSTLYQGVDVDVLPSTFRDGIKVTRRLGYDYIWIDSLCIVQDSKEDWDEESRKMGGIYSNAFATICASSSESCDTSFLARSSRLIQPTIDVKFIDEDGASSSIQVMRRLVDHILADGEAGPLHRRAWCYQEFHLSQRTISYDNTEINFKCRTHATCQCRQQPYPIPNQSKVHFSPSSFAESDLLQHWFNILFEYTHRKLTYYTDRLAALSGVVSILQSCTGWTYVAGMWSELVLVCLPWCCATTDPTHFDQLQKFAPTFSWASISEGVMYDGVMRHLQKNQYIVYTHIIQLYSELTGRNPFDRIAPNAFLELKGPVLLAELDYDEDMPECYAIFDECEWRFHPDTPLGIHDSSGISRVVRCKKWASPSELHGLQIYILILATSTVSMTCIDALVLTKRDTGLNHYERIGILLSFSGEIFDRTQVEYRAGSEVCAEWLQEAKEDTIRIY